MQQVVGFLTPKEMLQLQTVNKAFYERIVPAVLPTPKTNGLPLPKNPSDKQKLMGYLSKLRMDIKEFERFWRLAKDLTPQGQ